MSETEEPLQPSQAAEPEPITFAEFLEDVPPSQTRTVADLCKKTVFPGEAARILDTPVLQLHCTRERCNGLRSFRFRGEVPQFKEKIDLYLTYICSNCRTETRVFSVAVHVERGDGSGAGRCFKYGEAPPFGPPTPARLIRLFGSDRDVFLKGRRCENQGLGIGAFTYYRRVVENHKNQILGEIIRVSQKIGAPKPTIELLEAAKTEVQFSKALESVKDAIPQALLINGHNPLTLLHRALSVGVHEQTDERCLELAQDVRVVLTELAERLGQALKNEAELNTAIARLMKAKQDK
jgi:hypothetical protein